MGYGFVGSLAAGAAAGTAAGGALGVRSVQPVIDWAQQVRASDAQLLEQGHEQLPPIQEPENQIYRKPRNGVLVWGAGVLLGGFLTWLVVSFFVIIVGNGGGEMLPGEMVIASLLFGGMAGVFGFLIPGTLIGGLLWVMESRARLQAVKAMTVREVWEEREQLRTQLAFGETTPAEALRTLRGVNPEPMETYGPLPAAMPIPEAGVALPPMAILALASAISYHGYVRTTAGANSTAARVQRILTDPDAPERASTTITVVHTEEAQAVFTWAMGAFEVTERDEFREQVGYWAAFNETEPNNTEAIRMLSGGVGGYRRAQSRGIA